MTEIQWWSWWQSGPTPPHPPFKIFIHHHVFRQMKTCLSAFVYLTPRYPSGTGRECVAVHCQSIISTNHNVQTEASQMVRAKSKGIANQVQTVMREEVRTKSLWELLLYCCLSVKFKPDLSNEPQGLERAAFCGWAKKHTSVLKPPVSPSCTMHNVLSAQSME